jgi:hypothetical protein
VNLAKGNRTVKSLLLAFVGLLALPGAFAQGALEHDTILELHVDTITLPDNSNGDIVIKACSSCPTRTHGAEHTKYFIGEIEVGLAGMREHFKRYPFALLAVEVSKDRRSVLQIYASPPNS